MAAADKCQPDIIGMSALLTTTMTYMKTVIDGFEAAGQGPHQDGRRRRADQPDVRRRDRRRRLRRRTPRPRSTCSCGWPEQPLTVATYRILYWQEIPSQIKAEDDARRSERCRCREVHGADRSRSPPSAACKARTTTWRSGAGATSRSARDPRRRSPQAIWRELEAAGRLVEEPDMPVTLTINGHTHRQRRRRRRCSTAPSGSASACRPPASRTASARSAWSRSRDGMELLSPPTARSASRRRRSGCRARPRRRRRRRRSSATRCAAARCASSGTRSACRPARRRLTLDPAVTRDGDRILDRRRRNRRDRPGPIHGLAMDLGTTTVVAPPDRSRDRRAGRRRVVREPAALRRLRRDVAHPLRHRASAASC